jgi:glycosyltransferase involved in cell wall biosynthesis
MFYCNALVMPSLHEGLPYVLLEAMALAVPIVASRVGGIAQVLRDEATALLIAPGDAVALARCICRLHDQPALAAQLGAAARALQLERYAMDTMVERYVALFARSRRIVSERERDPRHGERLGSSQ